MMRSIWSPTAPRSLPRFFSGVCGPEHQVQDRGHGRVVAHDARDLDLERPLAQAQLDVRAVQRRRFDGRALDLAADDVDRQPDLPVRSRDAAVAPVRAR